MSRPWRLFAAVGGAYYLLIMVTAVPVDTSMPDMIGCGMLCLRLLTDAGDDIHG